MARFNLTVPISEKQIRKLQIGDHVIISGTIFTARDKAHVRALKYAKNGRPLPFKTQGGVLFHSGPIVRQVSSSWEIISAGPTTSTRLEKFEADFIKNFGIRIIIGKGGLLEHTEEALKQYGAVYCSFTGGAAVLAASFIESVESVEWIELGTTEAVWILKVKNFPVIVTIDTWGKNLYKETSQRVLRRKKALLKKLDTQELII